MGGEEGRRGEEKAVGLCVAAAAAVFFRKTIELNRWRQHINDYAWDTKQVAIHISVSRNVHIVSVRLSTHNTKSLDFFFFANVTQMMKNISGTEDFMEMGEDGREMKKSITRQERWFRTQKHKILSFRTT